MLGPQLIDGVKIEQAIATAGAGTSEINGAILDMAGYEGVLIVAKFGTAAANNTIKVEQGDTSNLTDGADLAGSQVSVGASDEIVAIDIYRPTDRYVRPIALRGTSTTLDWAVAFKYGAKKQPVDNSIAGTIASEKHASPAEGTA